MTETTLLVDADVIAVRAALYCQSTFNFGGDDIIEYHEEDLPDYIDGEIESYCQRLKTTNVVCVLSSSINFRKDVLPTYKEGRPTKPKLHGLAKEYIRDNYETREKEGLEGDDVLGILSTHPTLIKGKKIIVSIDKDMKTIPGYLFDPDNDTKARKISEIEADRFWLLQAMMGDTVDNYKGCPGIGKVRGTQLLEDVLEWGTPWASNAQLINEAWSRIVKLFESKELTEEDALVQARVARICRHTDYDYKKKEVILWTPQGA